MYYAETMPFSNLFSSYIYETNWSVDLKMYFVCLNIDYSLFIVLYNYTFILLLFIII